MSLRNRLLTLITILFVAAVGLGVSGSPNGALDLEVVVDVGDVTAYPGEVVEVPVYLSNYVDTIAGFNFWVQMDNPELMEFTTVMAEVVDTTYWLCTDWLDITCVDSMMVGGGGAWDFYHVDTNDMLVGTLDTTGTLVSGWEWVDARSLSGYGTDLNVAGIADLPGPPVTPGVAPQESGLLIKLVGQVYDIPDTMTERTVNLLVQTSFLAHFNFSTPSGESIGIVCDSVPDTTFWYCTNWAGDVCLNWTQVPGPPYDSISIDGYNINCHIDTSVVHVLDGSVTVLVPDPPVYGDADCSGSADISDLVYVVDHMFLGGPPMPCLENVDCDLDDLLTVTDLVCLVEWMFPPQ
ncbi:MAG: hypothetical protein OEV49_11520 [candidate division Zixibacteria bacterium]|nr:hypothetical protein [candidate division Zixibacteria bacterium]MDH3938557.1 hypothetical protein [candidate division Zixibacteria bacterium]MDH4033025.1 hypothetical protein [candidate division Zixibacteria bacterium]